MIESEDGVAVTPAGSPLRETVTGSLKPLIAAVVTVKLRAEPPLGREMELGAAEMLKSGTTGGMTARAAVAVCEREFAEPVTVMVAPEVAAAAVEAARVN